MKLATPVQILKLESLLLKIRQTRDVPTVLGYFTTAQQILNDINYTSEFSSKLALRLIGADTEEKLRVPAQILQRAIDYYKNDAPLIPQKEQQNISITNQVYQELQSQNTKFIEAEKKRLFAQAKFILIPVVFAIPVLGFVYIVKTIFNYEGAKLLDASTWVNQGEFGKMEFIIIVFDAAVVGLAKWIYGKYQNEFKLWYYEKRKIKIH